MRINFVLPEVSLAGGIRVVADYAKRLGNWGHHVTVAWPRPVAPSVGARVRGVLKWALRGDAVPRRTTKNRRGERTYFDSGTDHVCLVETRGGRVSAEDLPDADLTIGTWWTTLEWMLEYPNRVGQKVHFIQGDDGQTPMQPMHRLGAAWRQPMHRIAVSAWLGEPVRELVGDVPVSVVLNGVDPNQFFSSTLRSKCDRPTVGFLYSPLAIKGCDMISEALMRAKTELPNLRVVAFGASVPEISCPIPEFVEFIQAPPQERIREIYSSCDWWIWGSRVEGFGLPILEAMACGTPVIATPAGAAPELITSSTGRLLSHCDAGELASSIVELCMIDEISWSGYSRASVERAAARTTDHAAREFEQALEGFLPLHA